jgi:hypothetical protein
MEAEKQLSPNLMYELVADVGFRRHFHLGGIRLANASANAYRSAGVGVGVVDVDLWCAGVVVQT